MVRFADSNPKWTWARRHETGAHAILCADHNAIAVCDGARGSTPELASVLYFCRVYLFGSIYCFRKSAGGVGDADLLGIHGGVESLWPRPEKKRGGQHYGVKGNCISERNDLLIK